LDGVDVPGRINQLCDQRAVERLSKGRFHNWYLFVRRDRLPLLFDNICCGSRTVQRPRFWAVSKV
jgi:hypothetical protein